MEIANEPVGFVLEKSTHRTAATLIESVHLDIRGLWSNPESRAPSFAARMSAQRASKMRVGAISGAARRQQSKVMQLCKLAGSFPDVAAGTLKKRRRLIRA